MKIKINTALQCFLKALAVAVFIFPENVAFATKKSKKKCSKWYFFDILLHKNDLYKKNVEFLGINKRL
jgi:hypothetical protein